jgi:FAD/FMN-containing dehydrogenase/ferredoxin
MTQRSFLQDTVGQSLSDFEQLSPEQRASVVRPAFPDLHAFFDPARALGERRAPRRTRELAQALHQALTTRLPPEAVGHALVERIVTDDLLRSEADRDQNVYLGRLFTRRLTRAMPDLIFQPANAAECGAALAWARSARVPVTLRGAASTAMGGSVPNDGGMTLDLSRLDGVDVDVAARACVVGAGARLRTIHDELARRGLALTVYPSNLGGTLAGWFLTGGIGLNAFAAGRVLDSVLAADVLLPGGEHLRFHTDGRLDVPDAAGKRRTLSPDDAAAWFLARGAEPFGLADLAGSEGVLGLLLQLTVTVVDRPERGAFLLAFREREQALAAVEWITRARWIARAAGKVFPTPGNLKFLSPSHLHHTRRVWGDEEAREWRRLPSALSSDARLPWSRLVGPAELGAVVAPDLEHAGGYLFVDFAGLEAARAFAAALHQCPGSPQVLGEDSRRFAAEVFRPQQTKRLGPGLLAAEILLPAAEVAHFLPRAEALAAGAGRELDVEVYYLADGSALVIAAYLTDHRDGAFGLDLMIAPALLDLAVRAFHGRPYVLGRWQSPWFEHKYQGEAASRLRRVKRALDPGSLVNRGVLFGLELRGPLGGLAAAGFVPGVQLLRAAFASPGLSRLVRAARPLLARWPGPARGRGEPAAVGASFRAAPVERPLPEPVTTNGAHAHATGGQDPAARALHCVNCGECNSVCPVFHESKIRLPQMLTHVGEAMYAGQPPSESGSALLDLCMRCGKCEEVCQAGIPHLPLYQEMQRASDRVRPYDRERHAAIVASLRASPKYQRGFLDVRPGGYVKRTPASLPGVARYLVLRAENDAGPAATCIHCGACVPVCPTLANHDFQGADPRWITTEQHRCIGCGTCVEVCPANHLNGGQTLRVVEAPTPDWFVALEELERAEER